MNPKTNIFVGIFQPQRRSDARQLADDKIVEMSGIVSIRATGLGKAFRLYTNKWDKLRGSFLNDSDHSRNHWAIRNLSLEIPSGATFGIIGQNGSGKTTLLQLFAGLLKPTEGNVEVRGNLATLLELEGGFQYDLTGRENIYISCGLRGFSRKEVEKKIEDIIEFAELIEFIDQPIKHYSAGMRLRLAFATAINVEPDVLLIDEIFSVGDMAFQHKCARRFRQLQQNDTTIVLATHDLAAVKSLCDEALLLDRGEVIRKGLPEDVTNFYLSFIAEKIASDDKKPNREIVEETRLLRHGSGEAKVTNFEIIPKTREIAFGEEITFRFHVEYFADVPESILGFMIRDRLGNDFIGINTHEEKRPIGPRKRGDCLIIEFKFAVPFRPGTYSVSPGLAYHPTEARYLDWIDNADVFCVNAPAEGQMIHGFFWVPTEIKIQQLENGSNSAENQNETNETVRSN